MYAKRRKLLLGDKEDVKDIAKEIIEFIPEVGARIDERIAELGEDVWYEILRKLLLQVQDVLWVEHLEVMQHTRSSVGLRAYGQQDPLIEYRKEAVRLFREMQEASCHRIAELIPTVRIEAVLKEEETLKKAQSHIALAGGASPVQRVKEEPSHTPVRKEEKIGRNEYVTVTNGVDTESMKFKKAETLIASGDWKIVEK